MEKQRREKYGKSRCGLFAGKQMLWSCFGLWLKQTRQLSTCSELTEDEDGDELSDGERSEPEFLGQSCIWEKCLIHKVDIGDG